jgi:hypothetical protein
MNIENIGIALTLGVISLIMLVWGILVRSGKVKGWWVLKDTPIVPINAVYMTLPASVSFFMSAVALLWPELDERTRLFEYSGFVLILGIILTFWRPRWLVPRWLLWLEDNHGEIYSQLREEAQKLGAREWEKRVSTQEGLEEWAMEVRRKYGWDHPDAGNPFT